MIKEREGKKSRREGEEGRRETSRSDESCIQESKSVVLRRSRGASIYEIAFPAR